MSYLLQSLKGFDVFMFVRILRRFSFPLRTDFNSSTCGLQVFYLNLFFSISRSVPYRPEAYISSLSQCGGHNDLQETETISTFKNLFSIKGSSQSPCSTAKM